MCRGKEIPLVISPTASPAKVNLSIRVVYVYTGVAVVLPSVKYPLVPELIPELPHEFSVVAVEILEQVSDENKNLSILFEGVVFTGSVEPAQT